uniref:Ketoreductase domain-containing protein n=1 Tax=Nelumbo nucifera TaxID=4432 RepID=A0A822YDF2_NELNU|nr:TPA_asm: hypothetical protein HUJ06_031641 [Nelumbo nucifera]
MGAGEGESSSSSSVAHAAPLTRPLEGRVAIVTGASGGIGRAIALHLASLGANLVLNYVGISTQPQAHLLAHDINSSSSPSSSHPRRARAIPVEADISDPAQVKCLFDQAEQAFGAQPHILVNSAGVSDPKYPTIANTTVDDFDRIFSVNARGAFLCCREAANRLKRGGGGRIILISSSQVGGLKPGYGAYTASKAAVETMVMILAKELKGTGITANCVAPGPIATDMFFAGKGEEQVNKVIELCPLGRLGSWPLMPASGLMGRQFALMVAMSDHYCL